MSDAVQSFMDEVIAKNPAQACQELVATVLSVLAEPGADLAKIWEPRWWHGPATNIFAGMVSVSWDFNIGIWPVCRWSHGWKSPNGTTGLR